MSVGQTRFCYCPPFFFILLSIQSKTTQANEIMRIHVVFDRMLVHKWIQDKERGIVKLKAPCISSTINQLWKIGHTDPVSTEIESTWQCYWLYACFSIFLGDKVTASWLLIEIQSLVKQKERANYTAVQSRFIIHRERIRVQWRQYIQMYHTGRYGKGHCHAMHALVMDWFLEYNFILVYRSVSKLFSLKYRRDISKSCTWMSTPTKIWTSVSCFCH